MKSLQPGLLALATFFCIFPVGCGGSNAEQPTIASSEVAVSVDPPAVSLSVSQTQQFTATVTSTSNKNVTWDVNGVAGGTATVGTISSSGLYTAPAQVPSPAQVSVNANSMADPTKSDSANVTISEIAGSGPFTGVLTYHNDNSRTGQNLNESVLSPANVTQSKFGKLFSYPLDGQVFAQPLYVYKVPIDGQNHNVIYVATEHDTVYAFDADNKASSALWSVSFLNSAEGVTPIPSSDLDSPINPEIGVTGTPVIDGNSGTLYVLAATKENGNYVHRLHALDITSGAEKFGGPVVIQGSVPGSGSGSSNGQITFQTKIQLQRPALLLSKGVIYLAWASYNDHGLYHGWVMAYDASTLHQIAIWNDTPNGERGGIWQSGCGLSADSAGNVYVAIGNGTFDAYAGGTNYGDSFIKLTLNGSSLSVTDYFTPFNQQTLSDEDSDLGSSGLVLLPDQAGVNPHLGISAGKEGKIYLVNRDHLGKFQSDNDSQIVQSIPDALGTTPDDRNFSSAVYWNGSVYFVGNTDAIKQFQLNSGVLSTSPVSQSSHQFGYTGTSSISANGSGNGILWTMEAGGSVLHAYDATNLANELYNSKQAGSRDFFGSAIRFNPPTVANGKVYVAGQTEIAVFGLLP
jgi:hypothetical protein